MKTATAIVALVLLASPLLAAMGTYTLSKDFTGGTLSWVADGTTKTKFKVALTGMTDPTGNSNINYCVYIGIPSTTATASDWMGSDLGMIDVLWTYDATTPTWTATNARDNFCNAKTTTGKTCTLTGDETSADNAWSFASTTQSDRVTYSSKTLTIEAERINAATTAATDIAITSSTTSVLVGYATAACATTGELTLSSPVLVTGLTSPVAAGSSGSGSFGAVTYLSWVALLISYALLN